MEENKELSSAERKKMLDDLTASVSKRKEEEASYRELGKEYANTLLLKTSDSLSLRYSVGEFLRVLYKAQPDEACGMQLLRWSMGEFWGLEVKNHIPIFKEIYNELEILGAKHDDPLIYGDVDYSAWAESHGNLKIIGLICHPSMADDNTYLFILKECEALGDTFHGRTVWPRQTTSKYGRENWPNDSCWRDIEHPSYLTYKRHNFSPPYGDTRDKGYCFTYDGFFNSNVEGDSHRIKHSLEILRYIKEGINDPLELPKKQ